MKRYRQSVDEILEKLSPVGASWRDEHADEVVRKLESLPRQIELFPRRPDRKNNALPLRCRLILEGL